MEVRRNQCTVPSPMFTDGHGPVCRANITGDLATSGVKSFSINLDTAYGELTAPAGG